MYNMQMFYLLPNIFHSRKKYETLADLSFESILIGWKKNALTLANLFFKNTKCKGAFNRELR